MGLVREKLYLQIASFTQCRPQGTIGGHAQGLPWYQLNGLGHCYLNAVTDEIQYPDEISICDENRCPLLGGLRLSDGESAPPCPDHQFYSDY
jgi:hypothetical protein